MGEYLLSKLSQSGTNWQFRTPRHIIGMMVELMKPTSADIIVDPAVGTAGFLVSAGHMQDKSALQDEPFESLGSITELFPTEKAIQMKNKCCDRCNKK